MLFWFLCTYLLIIILSKNNAFLIFKNSLVKFIKLYYCQLYYSLTNKTKTKVKSIQFNLKFMIFQVLTFLLNELVSKVQQQLIFTLISIHLSQKLICSKANKNVDATKTFKSLLCCKSSFKNMLIYFFYIIPLT